MPVLYPSTPHIVKKNCNPPTKKIATSPQKNCNPPQSRPRRPRNTLRPPPRRRRRCLSARRSLRPHSRWGSQSRQSSSSDMRNCCRSRSCSLRAPEGTTWYPQPTVMFDITAGSDLFITGRYSPRCDGYVSRLTSWTRQQADDLEGRATWSWCPALMSSHPRHLTPGRDENMLMEGRSGPVLAGCTWYSTVRVLPLTTSSKKHSSLPASTTSE